MGSVGVAVCDAVGFTLPWPDKGGEEYLMLFLIFVLIVMSWLLIANIRDSKRSAVVKHNSSQAMRLHLQKLVRRSARKVRKRM